MENPNLDLEAKIKFLKIENKELTDYIKELISSPENEIIYKARNANLQISELKQENKKLKSELSCLYERLMQEGDKFQFTDFFENLNYEYIKITSNLKAKIMHLESYNEVLIKQNNSLHSKIQEYQEFNSRKEINNVRKKQTHGRDFS